MWAKTANKCKNCATNLYSHKAKGLCTKCYRVFRELEKIDKLESTDKDAFEILYTFIPFTIHAELKQKDIAQQKEKLKKAVKDRRLRYIELYGAIESGALDMNILRLEDVFNEIARRVTKKQGFYTNDLMWYQTRHNEEDRKYIALKLLKMLV